MERSVKNAAERESRKGSDDVGREGRQEITGIDQELSLILPAGSKSWGLKKW